MSCLKQMQTFFSIIVQHKSIPIPYYHLNRSWRHVLLQIILPCARCRDRQFKLICFACFVVLPSQRLKAAITCFCRWLIGCLANRLVDKFCLSLLSHREQRPTEPRLYQAAWQHRVSCGECGEKPRGAVQLRGRGKPTSHVPVSAWLQSFISLFLLSLLMLHAFIQVIVSISFNFLTSCRGQMSPFCPHQSPSHFGSWKCHWERTVAKLVCPQILQHTCISVQNSHLILCAKRQFAFC